MIDLDDLHQVRQADRLGLQAIAADLRLPQQALRAAAAGAHPAYPPELAGLARLAADLYALPAPITASASAAENAPPLLAIDTHPAYAFTAFLAHSARAAGQRLARPALDDLWLHTLLPETPVASNVAKQTALNLYQHIPLLWAGEPWLDAIAEDWRLRILYFAESAALAASEEVMQRFWSMARFPNFWPNGVAVVHLASGHTSSTEATAGKMATILAARRIRHSDLAAPGATQAEMAIHYLYLGNWIALYLAALYQVDPADRVPLQLLNLA